MTNEIRYWVDICRYNSTIDAYACWYCHKMKEIHGYHWSKELGAAAAIFALKLMNDHTFRTETAVNKHGNKIILQYEREISAIDFSSDSGKKLTFVHRLNTVCTGNISLMNHVIREYISEDVFCRDQKVVTDLASRDIERYLSYPKLRKRSYSV